MLANTSGVVILNSQLKDDPGPKVQNNEPWRHGKDGLASTHGYVLIHPVEYCDLSNHWPFILDWDTVKLTNYWRGAYNLFYDSPLEEKRKKLSQPVVQDDIF